MSAWTKAVKVMDRPGSLHGPSTTAHLAPAVIIHPVDSNS